MLPENEIATSLKRMNKDTWKSKLRYEKYGKTVLQTLGKTRLVIQVFKLKKRKNQFEV